MYEDLKGKVALVTGGSFGIGRTTILEYAKNKAKVAIADINEVGAEAVADEVRAMGGEALVIKADVSKSADVKAMVASVVEHYGRLGEAQDIADGVMYLSSNKSSFLLGHQLMIEGGFTAL